MKQHSGFALIELLLGSSILCVVILGCAHAWHQVATTQHQIQFRHFAEQSAHDLLRLIATNPTQKHLYVGHYTQPLSSGFDCQNKPCTAAQKASWDQMLWTQHLFLSAPSVQSKKVADFEQRTNTHVACVNLNGREIDVVVAWRSSDQDASCYGDRQHQVKLTQFF